MAENLRHHHSVVLIFAEVGYLQLDEVSYAVIIIDVSLCDITLVCPHICLQFA